MKKIAIFASGSGSNAENIINYFKNDTENVSENRCFVTNPMLCFGTGKTFKRAD